MSSKYRIVVLRMGELEVDRGSLTLGDGYGERIRIPMNAYVIVGGDKKIVVDTGVHDPEWVSANVSPCFRQDDETIERALEKGVGWSPEEVDIVINTHLHYHHCGENRLFKNAVFYVQEREWLAALNPVSSQRGIYYSPLFSRDAVDFFRWRFVRGFHEIVPGVAVFPTPGHAAGHQSVAVRTDEGVVVIAADAANSLDNLRLNAPAGIIIDTRLGLESLQLIGSIGDRVIPGHDPIIEKYQDRDFPTIPPRV